MEQIVIQIENKEKAQLLLELLKALDFVDLVNIRSEEAELDVTSQEESSDFFSLAGLWEGRDITLTSIRRQAWPRQNQ